ncbi:MAG: hypothetical protein ACOX0E_04000 [Syntrophomonadaceae bacterium]
MKVYYVCEYCEQIFSIAETLGLEGALQLKGICDDCAVEMGLKEPPGVTNRHFYS